MIIKFNVGFNEFISIKSEFSTSCNVDFIEVFVKNIIFWFVFNISKEVVSIHLFFFSKTSEEVSVVVSPSFSLSLKHSEFSSFVVVWINELSGIVLFNFEEVSIESSDAL